MSSNGQANEGDAANRSPRSPEPLIRVGPDFEAEYPGASALATECFANFWRTADMLMELHNRQTREDYQLSASARQILAIVDGAGEPLEPTVIAERLLSTTGTTTSLLDTLERRRLIKRLAHPDDRRKILVDITPEGRRIVDELLPTLHAREHALVASVLTEKEQRELIRLIAKLQQSALRASSLPVDRTARRIRPKPSPKK